MGRGNASAARVLGHKEESEAGLRAARSEQRPCQLGFSGRIDRNNYEFVLHFPEAFF
jgi:hypothetical protein